ncbi:SDR family oxidoreductase [Rouxiella badensis]|uniref:SDR family oxidoreductase n=1 Tax=Rouxiella badensis TaxID=1646377 RepID=UPI00301BFF81
MAQFAGKVAVITGSTQGLGAAIAHHFVLQNAEAIIICGRNELKGKELAEKLTSLDSTHVEFVRADLSIVEDCRRVIDRADRLYGKVDILINAAGTTDRGTILDTPPEVFDKIFQTNVRAPFFLMQEAIKIMKRNNIEGSIVNICSMSALAGQPFLSAYSSSKGALATLTRNTAYALLRNRIRVNGLNLGWMATDGEDQIMRSHHGADDNWLEEASAGQPFKRLIQPDEAARAVAFLASSESGLMTGSVINFDQSIWGGYDQPAQPDAPM